MSTCHLEKVSDESGFHSVAPSPNGVNSITRSVNGTLTSLAAATKASVNVIRVDRCFAIASAFDPQFNNGAAD